jgi:hypothetical protein
LSDIVTLGLALDSRPIVQGTKALDDFARSAKPASAGATALEKAVADVGKTSGALGAKLKPTNDALASIAKNTGFAHYEMVNFGRQFADTVVSVQGGMSLMTVGFQQLPQILDIFTASKTATVGGVFKQIGNGILGAITPMRAFGVAVAAAGAIGAAFYSNWHTATLQLDDTARSIGVTTGELSKLQAAGAVKGIGGEEFAKGIQSFARGVYDAKAGMGGLAEVFQVNNKRAGDFNSSLDTAANLIKSARDDQQRLVLLQQMGLPATMQWVRLLTGGADGLKKAKDSLAEFAASDSLVASARRFDESWNRTWTNFGLNARSAFQKAMETGGGFLDRMERLAVQAGNSSIWDRFLPSNHADVAKGMGITALSPFQQRFAGDSQNPASSNSSLSDGLRSAADRIKNGSTVDPAAAQRALALEQQRLGLLGQVATVNETIKAGELAISAARMQPGNKITDADVKRIQDYTKANALGTAQIRSQADAYTLESATLGMTTGSALAYVSVQQRINEEKRKGNELTPAQVAALRTEATALGEAALRAENMRFGYDALTNSGQTFLSTLRNSGTVWDAFKSAGVSALDAVSQKLMRIATDNLWTSAFGGSSSGLGALGSLFGGGSAAPSSIMVGDYVMPKFAGGTNSAPGGLAMINERGGEIVNLPSGAQVIPHDVSMAMANRIRLPAVPQLQSAPASSVSVPINITIDATGADAAGLARVEQSVAQLKSELPARIVAGVAKARTQRQL